MTKFTRVNLERCRKSFAAALGAASIGSLSSVAMAATTGPEFQLNYDGLNMASITSMAVAADGHIMVTWIGDDPVTGRGDNRAQLFNADGTAAGTEFQVAPDNNPAPSVVALSSGGYVIATTLQTGIAQVQRFAADGSPLGSPIVLAQHVHPGDGINVAADAHGNFRVLWNDVKTSRGIPVGQNSYLMTQSSTTYTQLFAADGTPAGKAIVLDSVPPQKVTFDALHIGYGNCDVLRGLALNSSGQFVVTYGTYRQKKLKSVDSVAVRTFNADAQPITAMITLDGYYGYAGGIDDAGNFVVSDELQVFKYDSNGKLNATLTPYGSTPNCEIPGLSLMPSGEMVVAWECQNGSIADSQTRYVGYFHADGSADGAAQVVLNDYLTSQYGNSYWFSANAKGRVVAVTESGDINFNAMYGQVVTGP